MGFRFHSIAHLNSFLPIHHTHLNVVVSPKLPFPTKGHLFRRAELSEREFQARELTSQALGSKVEDENRPPKMDSTTEPLAQNGLKQTRRRKKHSPESEMSRELDMCSKRGDFHGALSIFDKVTQEGLINLKQHNYNVLLYLCSGAAMGALKPVKGARLPGSGSIDEETCKLVQKIDINAEAKASRTRSLLKANRGEASDSQEVIYSDEEMDLALKRGFEIYDHMQQEGVPLNEATFTSVARLAVANCDGDLAFEMVKTMAAANIAPKLRSYGPALYTYCRNKEVEKAFEVDAHMLASGIRPEESELAALLKVSADAGMEDKVYLLLHRFRTTVRELSPSSVEIIEHWFNSEAASRAGKQNWENPPTIQKMKAATEAAGGGWHGLGWLGKGRWKVEMTHLDKKGLCLCCGEQLCTIDIDPLETDNFSKSLADLACHREVMSNEFKTFQSWLDEREPYEAIVDGANVGLYQQNFLEGGFNFHQLNSVVTAVQARSPNEKLPLIILHNRRTQGGAASSQHAKELLKKWMKEDALYATPTGSNDDWYWLYAAVKCKCLLVTNDEMRDHLFQLLGNDFFPKWKERHQESWNGSWHVPQSGGNNIDTPRDWLCMTRPGYPKLEVTMGNNVNCELVTEEQSSLPSAKRRDRPTSPSTRSSGPRKVRKEGQVVHASSSAPSETLSRLEAADKIGSFPIDLQI